MTRTSLASSVLPSSKSPLHTQQHRRTGSGHVITFKAHVGTRRCVARRDSGISYTSMKDVMDPAATVYPEYRSTKRPSLYKYKIRTTWQVRTVRSVNVRRHALQRNCQCTGFFGAADSTHNEALQKGNSSQRRFCQRAVPWVCLERLQRSALQQSYPHHRDSALE